MVGVPSGLSAEERTLASLEARVRRTRPKRGKPQDKDHETMVGFLNAQKQAAQTENMPPGRIAQNFIADEPSDGAGFQLNRHTGQTLPGAMLSLARPKSVAEGKLRLAALKALVD